MALSDDRFCRPKKFWLKSSRKHRHGYRRLCASAHLLSDLCTIAIRRLNAATASTRVLAEDSLGFYVGAGVGEPHLRTDNEVVEVGQDFKFDEHHGA